VKVRLAIRVKLYALSQWEGFLPPTEICPKLVTELDATTHVDPLAQCQVSKIAMQRVIQASQVQATVSYAQ
jgi:hypothetical protein